MSTATPPHRRWPHVDLDVGRYGQVRATWTWSTTPQPEPRVEPWRYLWHIFPGRHWPWLAHEEPAVINQLGPATTSKISRGAHTAVLNLLRCGATTSQFLQVTPGADLGQLRAAYGNLSQRLVVATAAWERIVANPTIDVLQSNAAVAAPIMGLPLRRLAPPMEVISDELIAGRLGSTIAEITRVTEQAADIEDALSHFAAPSASGVELGRLLHNPRKPALWSDPHFLPRRVGELSGPRATALLKSGAVTAAVKQKLKIQNGASNCRTGGNDE